LQELSVHIWYFLQVAIGTISTSDEIHSFPHLAITANYKMIPDPMIFYSAQGSRTDLTTFLFLVNNLVLCYRNLSLDNVS